MQQLSFVPLQRGPWRAAPDGECSPHYLLTKVISHKADAVQWVSILACRPVELDSMLVLPIHFPEVADMQDVTVYCSKE